MSNLRIISLLVGIFCLFLTFRIYRGPQWRRLNFILFGIVGLSLTTIALNPNLINSIPKIFSLELEERGRLLALLIISNIILWLFILYIKVRFDESRYQFDLLVRNIGYEESLADLAAEKKEKEIMVIIPAYNEAANLTPLLQRIPLTIQKRDVGVIVLDDGSNDSTVVDVKRLGVLVARNKINRGQGAATRLGYDILFKSSRVTVGVTMDADGQHAPEEIQTLVQPIIEGRYDLVIGSRILGSHERASRIRSIGIVVFSKIINFFTGLKLTDCSSGFKAFNVAAMQKLHLREDQFQAAEVIIEAAKRGLRIGEVPISIQRRGHGASKKGRDLRYGLLFAKAILKAWWRK